MINWFQHCVVWYQCVGSGDTGGHNLPILQMSGTPGFPGTPRSPCGQGHRPWLWCSRFGSRLRRFSDGRRPSGHPFSHCQTTTVEAWYANFPFSGSSRTVRHGWRATSRCHPAWNALSMRELAGKDIQPDLLAIHFSLSTGNEYILPLQGACAGHIFGEIMSLWVGFGGYIYKYPVYRPPVHVDGCDGNYTLHPAAETFEYHGLAIYRLSYMWQGAWAFLCTIIMGLIVSACYGKFFF